MPGAHTHIQYTLTLLFTLTMAQDQWTLQEKEAGKVKNEPAHGPPLQARVAAANRTVLAACKLLSRTVDPGAHGNEQGAKQNERGQER